MMNVCYLELKALWKIMNSFNIIMIGTSNIKIVPVLRNLGVYIDSNLTMKNQISNTAKVCNHYLRNIAFIRKYLNEDTVRKNADHT